MKFEAITIKDIAKALGLSTSTVSRALRDSYEISPETKEKVLAYAREMNYRPNPIALSLKEKRSSSIGVLVAEIANSFFSQAINGIESVAQEHGYNVIIAQSKEEFSREVSALHYLASRSVDGIILSVSSETTDFGPLQQLHDKKMPLVFFDRVAGQIHTHKVTADNFKGAHEATLHLINNGYTRIACMANASQLSITGERVKGYQTALAEAQLPFVPEYLTYCQHGGLVYEEVAAAMEALLQQKNKPDAIIGCADKITTNIMRFAQKKGIRIPQDIALIGFSNLDLTDLLSPSLSVVRQPAAEMGKLAAELLIKMIESKRPVTEFEQLVLPTEIFQRSSSARP